MQKSTGLAFFIKLKKRWPCADFTYLQSAVKARKPKSRRWKTKTETPMFWSSVLPGAVFCLASACPQFRKKAEYHRDKKDHAPDQPAVMAHPLCGTGGIWAEKFSQKQPQHKSREGHGAKTPKPGQRRKGGKKQTEEKDPLLAEPSIKITDLPCGRIAKQPLQKGVVAPGNPDQPTLQEKRRITQCNGRPPTTPRRIRPRRRMARRARSCPKSCRILSSSAARGSAKEAGALPHNSSSGIP